MLKRSQSLNNKSKSFEKEPKLLRKNVSSTMEIRMSPLPPPDGKYIYIPKKEGVKVTAYVKILKQGHQPVVDPRRNLEGIDKILHERHFPKYQNHTLEYKRNHQMMIVENKTFETASVIAKLEERRKKFFDRYQKLFAPAVLPTENDEDVKNVRGNLAELRVPKYKGCSSQFYNKIRTMLDKVA